MGASKIMGLDFGLKRIGVALADTLTNIGIPYGAVDAGERRRALEELRLIAEREGVSKIVVGKPLGLDGKFGDMARRAADFARELGAYADVPTVLWDERLSSRQAERLFKSGGVKASKRRRRGDVDALAAAIILESYLQTQAVS